MKSNTITLRVSDGLRDQIENSAIENDISFSEMARKLLASNSASTIEHQKNDLLNDFRFTQLIFWICDKYFDNSINETREFYEQHIQLIKELQNHPFFTEGILSELHKISAELQYYLVVDSCTSFFKFCDSEKRNRFNYSVFKGFIYSLYFDENNNLTKASDDD